MGPILSVMKICLKKKVYAGNAQKTPDQAAPAVWFTAGKTLLQVDKYV